MWWKFPKKIKTVYVAVFITFKSFEQIVGEYGFPVQQKEMISELFGPDKAELWAKMLGKLYLSQ